VGLLDTLEVHFELHRDEQTILDEKPHITDTITSRCIIKPHNNMREI
jgi:hypothetical protein